jgi:selenocysteine lyase/cysteine desulfurase
MNRLRRREFARVFAFGGSAALLAPEAWVAARATPVVRPRDASDEAGWAAIRGQFLIPDGVAVLNAANLCPSPVPVLDALDTQTRRLDRVPSPAVRTEMHQVKEHTRRRLAEALRVTPEELVLTRNTSESNNMVSNGLELKAGDEVLLFSDNHPSNLQAWREKSKRFGYSVRVIEQVNPHPGADYYVDAVRKALTAQTRLLGFSMITNTVGDVLPARELCALARSRDVLTLVDGAQALGVLDLDLRALDADFFAGSGHKWPCGPKETGMLFVNARVHARFWSSVVSLYPGEVGISRTHEGLGQRDEPALHALGEAIAFQQGVGMARIEARSRELTTALVEGLSRMSGVRVWTHPDAARRSTVVSFLPAALDPAKLHAALFDEDGVIGAARSGTDRQGIRFSPHFYNSHADVDRTLAALSKHLKRGV